jgi:hypothetical protein
MSDISARENPRPADPMEVFREMAQRSPRRAGANTETVVQLFPSNGLSQRTTGTDLVDVRAFAETIVSDATALMSRLEQIESFSGPLQDEDSVPIATVLRSGAAIVGGFALLCVVGTGLTGTVLLHPLLAWSLILMSVGFYAMGKVRN